MGYKNARSLIELEKMVEGNSLLYIDDLKEEYISIREKKHFVKIRGSFLLFIPRKAWVPPRHESDNTWIRSNLDPISFSFLHLPSWHAFIYRDVVATKAKGLTFR